MHSVTSCPGHTPPAWRINTAYPPYVRRSPPSPSGSRAATGSCHPNGKPTPESSINLGSCRYTAPFRTACWTPGAVGCSHGTLQLRPRTRSAAAIADTIRAHLSAARASTGGGRYGVLLWLGRSTGSTRPPRSWPTAGRPRRRSARCPWPWPQRSIRAARHRTCGRGRARRRTQSSTLSFPDRQPIRRGQAHGKKALFGSAIAVRDRRMAGCIGDPGSACPRVVRDGLGLSVGGRKDGFGIDTLLPVRPSVRRRRHRRPS